VKVRLSPGYSAPGATCFSRPEESFPVRAKLLYVVPDACVEELRKWLYHELNIGIQQSCLGLEIASTGKLVKDCQGPGQHHNVWQMPQTEVSGTLLVTVPLRYVKHESLGVTHLTMSLPE